MSSSNDQSSKADDFINLAAFWFTIILALAFVVLFFLVCAWCVLVLFGSMTTSQFVEQIHSNLTHLDQTALGQWLQSTLKRITH